MNDRTAKLRDYVYHGSPDRCTVSRCGAAISRDAHQWDHICPRGAFKGRKYDPENTRPTCGRHNHLGDSAVPLESRLVGIYEAWGVRAAEYFARACEEDGKVKEWETWTQIKNRMSLT